MRAAVYTGAGGPEVIEIRDIPIPKPQAKEVLVRVQASGLNRADLLQRLGFYPAPPGSPKDIPGLEFVGVVEELGQEVKSVKVGQRVFGTVGGGAHAEFLVVHEQLLVQVPNQLDIIQAAAVPESFMTAYDALITRAGYSPGEKVLIHAAGGGVGTALVQIANDLRAIVLATTRTESKVDRLQNLGAQIVVNVMKDDFSESILRETDGKGVNICMDFVGAPYFAKNVSVMARDGTIVVLGLLGGIENPINLEVLLNRRLKIVFTQLRGRTLDQKAEITRKFAEEIVPKLTRGVLKPVIDRVFTLDDLPEAHRYMMSNAGFGKIVISLSE